MATINLQVSGTVTHDYIPVSATFQTGGGLAKYVRFFLNGSGASSLESFSSPVPSKTSYYQYTGLRENTTYSLTVHFYDSNVNSLGSHTISVRTPSAPDTSPPNITRWGVNQTGVRNIEMYYDANDNVGVGGYWFYLNGNNYSSTSYGYGSTVNFTGLSPDTTYTLGVKAYDVNGNQSSMNTFSWRTLKDRPSSFYWDSGKTAGQDFNISASEWNRLTSKINEFRSYKGYSSSSFTYAYRGNDFTASMYNQAVSAISGMSPPTSTPNTRSRGDDIRASDIDRLRLSLNSIN